MSIFKIPLSVCRAIERRIADFWWKNSATNRGIHWKSWDILKQRKDMGGMGFKDLIVFNRAMLGKQAWRMARNPSTLWSRFLKGLYFPHSDFWHATTGFRPSWGWQSLLMGRETIEEPTMWSVRDGKSVSFRGDKWLRRGKLVGPALLSEPKLVADFIDSDPPRWNVQKLQQVLPVDAVEEVLAIPLPSTNIPDKLVWTAAKSGVFSVKSGYNWIRKTEIIRPCTKPSSSYQYPKVLWKKIWNLNTLPRIKIFLWQMCHNALHTMENLYKRKVVDNLYCPICKEKRETPEHLLLLCPWTCLVWSDPILQVYVDKCGITRIEKWLLDMVEAPSSFPLERFAEVLWLVWKERNCCVFRRKSPDPHVVLAKLQSSRKILSENRSEGGESKKDGRFHWLPPGRGKLKLNIDAAFLPGSFSAAVAGVCRDEIGRFVGGFAETMRASDSLSTEALALRCGLLFLDDWRRNLQDKTTEVEVESDCKDLVDALSGVGQPSWVLGVLFNECRLLFSSCAFVFLAHCSRAQNFAADWVAKAQSRGSLAQSWVVYPPISLLDILCADAQKGNCLSGPLK